MDEQPLRTAPAEAGGDDLKRIEDTVSVLVDESSHRIAVADQQSSFAVEGQRVTAAGEFRTGRLVNMKIRWQIEPVGQIQRTADRDPRDDRDQKPGCRGDAAERFYCPAG